MSASSKTFIQFQGTDADFEYVKRFLKDKHCFIHGSERENISGDIFGLVKGENWTIPQKIWAQLDGHESDVLLQKHQLCLVDEFQFADASPEAYLELIRIVPESSMLFFSQYEDECSGEDNITLVAVEYSNRILKIYHLEYITLLPTYYLKELVGENLGQEDCSYEDFCEYFGLNSDCITEESFETESHLIPVRYPREDMTVDFEGEYEEYQLNQQLGIEDFDTFRDAIDGDTIYESKFTSHRTYHSNDPCNKCEGFTFVITGKPNTFKNRDALVSYVERQGGKVTGDNKLWVVVAFGLNGG